MKKLFALLIALMMVFALVACDQGDNPGNTDNPGTSQGGEDNPGTQGGENNNDDGKIDTSTVSGFFSSYGLTEANIKPDGVGDGEIKANPYIESQAEVTYKTALDFEKVVAWRDLLMSATKAASDNGKISNSAGGEYTTPDWQDTASKSCTATWIYKYKGDTVIVTIDTTYEGAETYFAIVLEKI